VLPPAPDPAVVGPEPAGAFAASLEQPCIATKERKIARCVAETEGQRVRRWIIVPPMEHADDATSPHLYHPSLGA
jgi:hypothetical protein